MQNVDDHYDRLAAFWQARAWHSDKRLKAFRLAVFRVVLRQWGKALARD